MFLYWQKPKNRCVSYLVVVSQTLSLAAEMFNLDFVSFFFLREIFFNLQIGFKMTVGDIWCSFLPLYLCHKIQIHVSAVQDVLQYTSFEPSKFDLTVWSDDSMLR